MSSPEPLSDERLAEIEARCAAATPGPLVVGIAPEEPDTFVLGNHGILWCRVVGSPGRSARHDAQLFSEARETELSLLDEVKRLRAELEKKA